MIAGRGAGYALLGLAALLLAIAAASTWSGASGLAGRGDDTRAIERAAAAFVTSYGTFDFRDPGAYTARLASHTSGALREAISTAALDAEASRQRRSLTTRIESLSVTALSAHDATVSVTAAQERRWVDPTLGRSLREQVKQRVICRLVREEGRWLVAELHVQSEERVRPAAR